MANLGRIATHSTYGLLFGPARTHEEEIAVLAAEEEQWRCGLLPTRSQLQSRPVNSGNATSRIQNMFPLMNMQYETSAERLDHGRSVTDDVVARVAERLEPLELASGPALARCTHSSGVAPWERERVPNFFQKTNIGNIAEK